MDIGVVIGRFQVESLHEGHRYLINEAFHNHRKVIIFVGCARIQGSKYDPLDYQTRERMLKVEYPDAIILPIHDRQDDQEWSETLDSAIRGVIPNLTGARLYGGRDSFKAHYKGIFTPVSVESGIQFMNGREQREAIGRSVRGSPDFRAGIIYATQQVFPHTRACVDMAVIKDEIFEADVDEMGGKPVKAKVYEKGRFILLGKKPYEKKWRLPGGMVDPQDDNLEAAARRELSEETGLSVEGSMTYLGSFKSGDWRFKNAGEMKPMTSLFLIPYSFGKEQAGDDLSELKWHPLSSAEREVVKSHKALVSAVRRHFNDQ